MQLFCWFLNVICMSSGVVTHYVGPCSRPGLLPGHVTCVSVSVHQPLMHAHAGGLSVFCLPCAVHASTNLSLLLYACARDLPVCCGSPSGARPSSAAIFRTATSRYTTAEQSTLEDLKCQICLNTLRQCVALEPCGHNFCATCLSHHLGNSLQGGMQLSCPFRCGGAGGVRRDPISKGVAAVDCAGCFRHGLQAWHGTCKWCLIKLSCCCMH